MIDMSKEAQEKYNKIVKEAGEYFNEMVNDVLSGGFSAMRVTHDDDGNEVKVERIGPELFKPEPEDEK